MAHSQIVKQHLAKNICTVQYLIDTPFFYEDLNNIAKSTEEDKQKYITELKNSAPVFLKKKVIKKAVKSVIKKEKFSTKKVKLVNTDMTYAERLAKTGYKKRTWKIRDRD